MISQNDERPPAAPPIVPEDDLRDLDARLRGFRRVGVDSGQGWGRGVPASYLDTLLEHWADGYDWRVHEERIRTQPWEILGEREPFRAIVRTSDLSAPAVILLHGWPDSVLRFERLLPRLADLNVVVPALPGYPFALPDTRGGRSAREMAGIIGRGLADRGFERYVVSAGDIGCDVAEALAAEFPDSVSALHLTDVSQVHYLVDPPADLSAAERDYLRRGHHWQSTEGAYSHEQSTKPRTISAALGDSPAGLAAWIVEKLHGWTDHSGDLEDVFPRDDILTWIAAYWFSGCIGPSFTPYAVRPVYAWPRVPVPAAFTIFPKDLVNAPREFADRFFSVDFWQESDRGGHFAAWERPDDYVHGIRSALSLASS